MKFFWKKKGGDAQKTRFFCPKNRVFLNKKSIFPPKNRLFLPKNFFLTKKSIFFWFLFKNINYGGSLYKRTDMNTSSIWTLVRSKFQVLSILYKFDKKKWLCLFPIFLWYCIYIQYSKNDDLYIYKKIFMGNRQTKYFFVKT